MQIFEFTDSNSFNVIFSIYVYLTIIIAPAFAVLSMFRN